MHDAQKPPKDFQLPKHCRLTNSTQFQAVFSQHKSVSNQYFRILVRHRQNQPDARIGIIVSRRVSRKAVNRNRIKRQLREAFRLNRQNLKNMDMVIIARQNCDRAATHELYKSVVKLLKKLEK